MKSANGFTLTETLVGLAILGLAFSGLFETTHVIARFQRGAAHATADTAARTSASRVLQMGLGDGSALSGGLDGDRTGFTSTCLDGLACGARIEDGARLVAFHGGRVIGQAALPVTSAEFRYASELSAMSSWSGSSSPGGSLRVVTVVGDRPVSGPIATLVLHTDEPPGCVFDDVGQTCRGSP